MADMGAAGFDPSDGGMNVHVKNSPGGATTIADGADANAGLTTNTAVTGDNPGTTSAKLRGLNKLFADVWDNVNHWLQVKVMNGNANGQAIMANSAPVALASDQPAIKARGDFLEQTSLSVNSLNADLVASLDVSAYKWIAIQVTGTWTGTLNFQGSNDNVNFSTYAVYAAPGTAGTQTNITANGLYGLAVQFHYFRCRMTGSPTGTANGVADFFGFPPQLLSFNAVNSTQSGTWTVQPGNTPNTTPWLTTQANNNASVPAGAGNTVVKASAGALATIVVTTAGTGAGNVQLFDNATTNSGTVLFAFPATVSVAQFYQVYGWGKNGITAQNVANGPVFTVFYA